MRAMSFGRNRTLPHPGKAAALVACVGLLVFCCGAGSLAWALGRIGQPAANPLPRIARDAQGTAPGQERDHGQHRSADAAALEPAAPETEVPAPEENSGADADTAGDAQEASGKETDATDAGADGPKSETAESPAPASGQAAAPEPQARTADDRQSTPGTDTAPATPIAPQASKRKTIRYKTVRHKAAVATHTETDDGVKVTWTLCPACGKKHSKSYTEKVRIR